jgi:hypothetical protein
MHKLSHYKDALRPLFILLAIVLIGLAILVFIDGYKLTKIFSLILNPTQNDVVEILLANAGSQIIIGLLGIVMTVVAIIVELAANRYTERVIDLFVKDKVNIIYFVFISSTSLYLMIVLFLSRSNKIPTLLTALTSIFIIVCIITLVPYFIYVFRFLEPSNIITKIEMEILKSTKHARRIVPIKKEILRKKIEIYQEHTVKGIDQLTDIIMNSIEKKDYLLATNCIKSITNFSLDYLSLKHEDKFYDEWYKPSNFVRYNNADFVTLMDDSFKIIINEKTWVEQKLLRQLKTAFTESINKARDLCTFTAQCFYIIGKKTVDLDDARVSKLVIKFFNTLIRATFNEKDVKTCFNLLNQYRLFGEYIIKKNNDYLLLKIVNYFKYYGLLAVENFNLPFILETIAHDICDLSKKAYTNGLDKKGEILNALLTIDDTFEKDKRKSSLRGILKAQIILAVFYLSINKKETKIKARKIFNDILIDIDSRSDGYERIYMIIKELKYLKADFWEIIDRGLNIDYVPAEQKKYLNDFKDWIAVRQILLYCFHKAKGDIDKSEGIIKEFSNILTKLPKEIPVELKEFEALFGANGMDSKENFYFCIKDILKSLMIKTNLKKELENVDFMDKKINTKTIDDYIKSIKNFETRFDKIYKLNAF